MRKIKVVMLLVRQLQHGFTKLAKVSPNLTVTHNYYAEYNVSHIRDLFWHLMHGLLLSFSRASLFMFL